MEQGEENGPPDVFMASNADELAEIMADANKDESMALLMDPVTTANSELQEIDKMAQSYFALNPYDDANLIPWEPSEMVDPLPQAGKQSLCSANFFHDHVK